MELFTSRVGLRLVRSSARFSRTLVRFESPFFGRERLLRLPEGPKLRITLFETHSRIPVRSYFCKSEKSNGHNLRPERRLYSDQPNKDCHGSPVPVQKPTIFQKMKQMTKDYWYVLLPVHVTTSVGWMLIFYTAAKNSVDVIWIMEKLHLSEKYIEALRGSSAGFWAVAYALYKICTPVRYMVTVGGTTLSVKYLSRMGYMKAKPRAAPVQQVEHRPSIGKLGSKHGQTQADPPKT